MGIAIPCAFGAAWRTLAQKKTMSPEQVTEVWFWLAVLVVVAALGGVIGWVVYRRVRKAGEPAPDDGGLTLSDMRRMYEAGEMSHEEYTAVRQRIIGKTTAAYGMPADGAVAGAAPPPAPPPLVPPPLPPPAPPELLEPPEAPEPPELLEPPEAPESPDNPPAA